MTRCTSLSVLASEFDNFLFAPIADDQNDMPLSVLSALARLDIDPWQEAAELAQLPREAATQRLASSIGALADGPSAHLDPGTIAARLIALLPRRARSKISSRGKVLDADERTQFRAGMCMLAVFAAFILAAQWIVASRVPPAQVDGALAPASNKVLRQMAPPNPGQ
jgi:hypothetical protein